MTADKSGKMRIPLWFRGVLFLTNFKVACQLRYLNLEGMKQYVSTFDILSGFVLQAIYGRVVPLVFVIIKMIKL